MRRFSWHLFLIIFQCALVAPLAAGEAQGGTGPADCVASDQIKTTRPDPKGVPTKVSVGLYVIDLQGIDNVKQSFTADFVLGLAWKDPRLVETPGDPALVSCRLGLHEVWHPEIFVLNKREVETRLPELVEVRADGWVLYDQRYYGTFTSPLDLTPFPFDRQVLPISVISHTQMEEVEFVLVEADRADTLSIADWTIDQEGTRRVGVLRAGSAARGGGEDLFPRFDYEFTARRHISYYVWKVIGPLTIIVLMSWAVFWIDPAQIGVQVGIATTAILTLIAFLFSLEARLPRISYLTSLDYFVFGSLSLVFFAFVQAILTCSLGLQGNIALARRIDKWSRWVFPISFALVVLSFLS